MSYCRFSSGFSDVYVIGSTYEDTDQPCWVCFCEDNPVYVATKEEMIKHLEQHVANGIRVPDYAFNRLRREIQDDEVLTPDEIALMEQRRKPFDGQMARLYIDRLFASHRALQARLDELETEQALWVEKGWKRR